MKYDGYDLNELLRVEKTHRPLIADLDAETVDRSGSDGSRLSSVRLKPKVIDVDVRLITAVPGAKNQILAMESLRRILAGRLFRRKLCELVLDDAPDLYEMAVLDGGVDLDSFVYTREATLSWMCPSPASYGTTHRKSSLGGIQHVRVIGTYPAAPVITIDADGPVIVEFDGDAFIVNEGIKGSLVIDAANRTVTCDGRPVSYSIFSDFPEWEPGNHSVSCNRPFDLSYEERWL